MWEGGGGPEGGGNHHPFPIPSQCIPSKFPLALPFLKINSPLPAQSGRHIVPQPQSVGALHTTVRRGEWHGNGQIMMSFSHGLLPSRLKRLLSLLWTRLRSRKDWSGRSAMCISAEGNILEGGARTRKSTNGRGWSYRRRWAAGAGWQSSDILAWRPFLAMTICDLPSCHSTPRHSSWRWCVLGLTLKQ